MVALFYVNNINDVDDESAQSIDVSAKVKVFMHKNNLKSSMTPEVTSKYLKNKFSDLLLSAEENEEYSRLNTSSSCSFEVNYVGTEQEAMDLASKSLSDYAQKKAGPTLIVVDSIKPLSTLTKKISGMNNFPVAPFANDLGNHTLPAFQWEKKGADAALTSFLVNSVLEFPERVHYSRYANIPL